MWFTIAMTQSMKPPFGHGILGTYIQAFSWPNLPVYAWMVHILSIMEHQNISHLLLCSRFYDRYPKRCRTN